MDKDKDDYDCGKSYSCCWVEHIDHSGYTNEYGAVVYSSENNLLYHFVEFYAWYLNIVH